METRWYRILVITALALALLPGRVALAQEGHSQDEMSESMMEMMESIEELRQLSGAEFEIAYVNRIIPHHEGAVMMAEVVVDKAPHVEVRDAAAQIIKDQQREIEELTSFLRDTHGQEVNPDERQMMSHDMMEMHENANPEMAEKMFLLMMREHHQTAVEMGEIVLEKATSEQLREQAEKMIESQRAEQEQFGEWLQTWYGIEAPEPTGDMEAAMAMMMGGMPHTGAGGMASRAGAGVLQTAALVALVAAGLGYTLRHRLV